MPKRQDYGGKKKLIFLKAFPLNSITELMQPTTDDLIITKVYTAHSGDFVLFK